jgi:hypothetical protein
MYDFVIATFRAAFPEFSDIAVYPDAMLTFWAAFATAQVNCNRWGDQTLTGIYLYVAHEITLAVQNAATASLGGSAGSQSGPANSKTVGSATIAYDTQQTAERDGGYWNLTTYGKQFLRLARIFGSGVVQV